MGEQKTALTLLLILCYAMSTLPLVGASFELWSQTYGGPKGDYARSLVETFDGGYALVGISRDDYGFDIDCLLVKTDAYGNMEWNQTYKEFSADSLIESSDGGYAIAVGNGLVKTDAFGNIEWNCTYDGGWASSLIETSDGGYALAGYSGSLDIAGKTDFWFVKTDAQGIPEFPSWFILPLFLIATSVVVILKKKLYLNIH